MTKFMKKDRGSREPLKEGSRDEKKDSEQMAALVGGARCSGSRFEFNIVL